MHFEIVSTIPQVFAPYLDTSILGRAQKKQVFTYEAYDLHDWSQDKHKKVDDYTFGGGQGLLMKPDPIFDAVEQIAASKATKPCVVLFSPVGKPYTQACAERLAGEERVIFVCGRYEGMDERVYTLADEVYSLGDYVLTGGELAAMAVIDSVVRLLPGGLGNDKSAEDESFSDGLLEYAQYTRPATFRDMEVPEVLLSGNHGEVDKWRRKSSIERTAKWRPDLLAAAELTPDERAFADSLLPQDL